MQGHIWGLFGQNKSYREQAIVDKNHVVAIATLVSGIHLLHVVLERIYVVFHGHIFT